MRAPRSRRRRSSRDFSRATFYRLFESCEACLLEAFERCAETTFTAVSKAARECEGDCAERLEAGLGELVELLAAEPEVARFVLVEIRVGGPVCREAQLRWLERFAGLLVDAGQGGSAPRGEGLARMAAGAMATLLSLRLIESGPRPLPEMLEELAHVGLLPRYGAAVQASKSFEAATPAPDVGAPKARQKRKAIRPFEGQAQREQLLGAMTKLAGASGYEATRVADVSRHAGLPGYVFYTHFASKEECLLAAFDAAVGRVLAGTKAAMAGEGTAAERIEAGLGALVESLAEQPATARLVAVEIRRSGANGERRYEEAVASFAQLFAEASGNGQAGTGSDVARLVTRTVARTIAWEVAEGRAAQLEELLPDLVFTVLAPCVGGERAAAEAHAVSGPQPR